MDVVEYRNRYSQEGRLGAALSPTAPHVVLEVLSESAIDTQFVFSLQQARRLRDALDLLIGLLEDAEEGASDDA